MRNNWSGNIPYPVGYALKTDTLDEAKEFVNEKTIRMPLDIEKWEYVQNALGNYSFKTNDAEALEVFSYYLFGTETEPKFDTLYADIKSNGKSFTLSTETTTLGRSNYLTFKKLDLESYFRGNITRESDYDDWVSRDIAWVISYWRDENISDSEWTSYNDYYFIQDISLPFPEGGNKYYFYDRFTDTVDHYYNLENNTIIGFIDTGDLSTSYAQQLLDNDWDQDAGETSKFSYGDRHVELKFVPAEQCDRPDIYTKGIFYIQFQRYVND